MAKLKDLLKENFSLVGGIVSTPVIGSGTNTGLTDIVEDMYGKSESRVSAKEVKEAISDIGSDQYISDHYLTESNYFAKPGKNSRGLPESQSLFFSPSPTVFVSLCSSSFFSPHFDEELPKIAIAHE